MSETKGLKQPEKTNSLEDDFEAKMRDSLQWIRTNLQADEALKYSQAILNLTLARNNLAQTEQLKEPKK